MAYFGLTGGAASGKSTVAQVFRELGAKIVDADEVGHELLRAHLPAYQETVRRFGNGVVDPSGEIDRKRLGAIVFADPEARRDLNAILHPRIIEAAERLASNYELSKPSDVVLVDAALIFEAGIGGRFQKVIVVWCRPEQLVDRLMAKAGLTREEAERRIAAQMSPEEKRRRADFLIDNSGSLADARRQVEDIYPKLQRLAGGKDQTQKIKHRGH